MCFNVLIGNHDDHAKNFAFIYNKGWAFSPAYDLLPCGMKGDCHTTSVNDNPLPSRADVLALAAEVGLPDNETKRIYDDMEHQISCFQ